MAYSKKKCFLKETILLGSQFLLSLPCLQDVDEVFEVVKILGPGQPAAHSAHNRHRRQDHVVMLECVSRGQLDPLTNQQHFFSLSFKHCPSHLQHLLI